LVAGCDSSPLGEFEGSVCVEGADALAELAPAEGVDFVALRSGTPDTGVSLAGAVIDEWGVRCATATDPMACATALDALPFEASLFRVGIDALTEFDLATTRGEQVSAVSEMAELLDVVGDVDTANEAALVAYAAGHEMPCGQANVRKEGDGFVLLGTRGHTCGGDVEHFEITVSKAGVLSLGEAEVAEEGDPNCAIGRRPEGLRGGARAPRSVGQVFANAARLEAASIPAFAQLARELDAHAAPRSLVRAAWASRRDEIRHAMVTARLARRFGAAARAPAVARRPARSLVEMAVDNAAEGCVRETFGALVAMLQARTSREPIVRRAMRRIAQDEIRHATLSWAIDAWARGRLPAADRRRLDEVRRRAVASLRAEISRDVAPEVARIAGVPGAEASMRLVSALDGTLWRS
jgi:hypothetical protein